MTFSPDVYEQIREGAQRSAAAIVPLVYSLLEPRTVVDVGCGEGWFSREFARDGCKVTALDETVPVEQIIRGDPWPSRAALRFLPADLTGDAWANATLESDLAVCLEVAEHLPPGAGDGLVRTLCALAPVVLFSAAVPGQGGHGHLNEQWPAYWAERFLENGHTVSGALRWMLWDNAEVEPWYQQNLLVAVRDVESFAVTSPAVWHRLFGLGSLAKPIPIVHPTTFEARVAERDQAWAQLRAHGIEPQ